MGELRRLSVRRVAGLVLAASLCARAENILRLLDMEKYPMARCLDGSPGGFHFWPATTEESKDKWIIWHTGGGWCSLEVPMAQKITADHCALRRETTLGSSIAYPLNPTPVGWTVWGPDEALSDNPDINPMMKDWNKVVMIYCDGNSFSGQVTDPLGYEYGPETDSAFDSVFSGKPDVFNGSYEQQADASNPFVVAGGDMHDYNTGLLDKTGPKFRPRPKAGDKKLLHFRGKYILDATIDTLLSAKYGIGAATDLVISGSSAGGLATYLHADQWTERVLAASTTTKKPTIVAMPESGFFLDWDISKAPGSAYSYAYLMRKNFEAFNVSGAVGDSISPSVDPDCVQSRTDTAGDVSDCMLAEHVLPFVQTPTFVPQSTVDAWSLPNVLGTATDADKVNKYREVTSTRILDRIYGKRKRDMTVFVDSCKHHCGYWSELLINGTTKFAAFAKWYAMQSSTDVADDSSLFWWQPHSYPCSECCHALPAQTAQILYQ